jgi:hypothetical protein
MPSKNKGTIVAGLSWMLLLGAAMPLPGQWMDLHDKIPRNKDGSPNLNAPLPPRKNGHPDLSGIWIAQPAKLHDITVGMKPGEVEMLPAAEKLFQERVSGDRANEDPDAHCLPQGVPKIHHTPLPFKILQEPNLIAILYEVFGQYRQFFLDGRPLPKDPNPQWFGYSTGKWDGDTLVVESNGFNGKAWLDQAGHPTSEALLTTERFRRIDFGHMEVTTTIVDPDVYKKPWTVTQPLVLFPDTDLLEHVCNENNKDLEHLQGKFSK